MEQERTRPGAAPTPGFSPRSRSKLTRRDLGRFAGDTLFDRVARVVCEAECLPRKELYEAWEVARRARRLFRGGRVVDLAAGHGLLAHLLLLLDDTSPSALVVDPRPPASAAPLHDALVAAWPRLHGRIVRVVTELQDVELSASDLVVASHACGPLTDRIIDRVLAVRARAALLPCCQDLAVCDTGHLAGWLDGPLAVDVVRATRVQAEGYRVWTQTIPEAITARNRLLLAAPAVNP